MWKSTTPFQITMSKLCALRPFWEVFFNRIREKGYKGWPSQNKTMGKKGRQMKTGDIYYIYASHHVCLCWSSDSKAFPYTCLLACVLAASNRGMGVSLSPGECEWTGLQFFHPSAPPPAECLCDSPHIHMQRERVCGSSCGATCRQTQVRTPAENAACARLAAITNTCSHKTTVILRVTAKWTASFCSWKMSRII